MGTSRLEKEIYAEVPQKPSRKEVRKMTWFQQDFI